MKFIVKSGFLLLTFIFQTTLIFSMDTRRFAIHLKQSPIGNGGQSSFSNSKARSEPKDIYSGNYCLHDLIKMKADMPDIIECIKNYSSEGRSLDEVDYQGFTPLYLACFYKRIRAIEILLKHKVDVRKVLNHRQNDFLNKNSHISIKKMLEQRRNRQITSSAASSAGSKASSSKGPANSQAWFNGSTQILFDILSKGLKCDEKDIRHEMNVAMNKADSERILYFRGIILKLIMNNDINNLKRLINLKIPYTDQCFKDVSIMDCAIRCASNEEAEMVGFLFSKIDVRAITEENLFRWKDIAVGTENKVVIDMLLDSIKLYFPESNIVMRANQYNFGKRVDEGQRRAHAITEAKEQKKRAIEKRNAAVKIFGLGIAIVGMVLYQLAKKDKYSA